MTIGFSEAVGGHRVQSARSGLWRLFSIAAIDHDPAGPSENPRDLGTRNYLVLCFHFLVAIK